jgi:hypothetical protein
MGSYTKAHTSACIYARTSTPRPNLYTGTIPSNLLAMTLRTDECLISM